MTVRQPTLVNIWAIAWPMMLAYCSVPLMGIASVAVMGHLDDPRFLGGVGLATNFFAFFYFVFAFIRWSTTGLTAQAAGRLLAGRGGDDLPLILVRALALGIALGLALILLRPLWLDAVVGLLTHVETVRQEASIYAGTRVFGAPALLATYALTGWFIGTGRTKSVMAMTIVANIANILLLLLFIYGMDMRSGGAGLATAIAEWIGLAVGLFALGRMGQMRWRDMRYSELLDRAALRLLFVANTNVLLKTLFTILIFFAFLGISGRLSAPELAANLVLLQMFYLASYAFDGFANACETLAGQAEGAGQTALADRALFMCLCCATGVGGIFSVIYALGGPALVAAMSDIDAVRGAAQHYYLWMALVPLVQAGATVFDGVFVGMLRLDALRNSAIIAAVGFVLILAVTLPLMGNHGLWLSFSGYFLIRQLVAWRIYHSFRHVPARAQTPTHP